MAGALDERDTNSVANEHARRACDFVSRYFAPRGAGIPEDPVTGSTHCALIPYWSKRLGKREFCEDRQERVGIGGNAVTYIEGKLNANA